MKIFFFTVIMMLIAAFYALATTGENNEPQYKKEVHHLTHKILSTPQKEHYSLHYSDIIFFYLARSITSIIAENIQKIEKAEESYRLLEILLKLPQKCYMQGLDLLKIYLQEELNYIDSRTQITLTARNYFQSMPQGSDFKIPPVTHHIYFSIPNAHKQICDSDEDKIVKSISLLNNEHSQFIHYFWTNVPNIISPKIQSLPGIQVKNISEFSSHALWTDLQKNIDSGISDKVRFIIASDISRLMVMEKYGGIYMDLDYEIYNAAAIVQHMKNLNFFTGLEFIARYTTAGNAFFAASAKHPIISRALGLVTRNIPYFDEVNNNGYNVPEYIKKPCNKFYSVLLRTGPTMLGIAYNQASNINENLDLILPAGVIFNIHYARFTTPAAKCYSNLYATNIVHFEGLELETIGADMFCSSWFR